MKRLADTMGTLHTSSIHPPSTTCPPSSYLLGPKVALPAMLLDKGLGRHHKGDQLRLGRLAVHPDLKKDRNEHG